jgi:2-oxoglutarate dehydrogenase E2 component (dihydrolipoamide succinyltransferase)
MATEIKVPTLGESVTEATVAKWFKQPGDAITADEPLVELETDKVTVEVPAPASGVLEAIAVKDGETVGVGAMLGTLIEGAAAKPAHAAPAAAPAAHAAATAVGAATVPPAPSAARLMAETGVTVTAGSGKHGQVLKGDVVAAIGAAGAPRHPPRRPRRPPPRPRRAAIRSPTTPPARSGSGCRSCARPSPAG